MVRRLLIGFVVFGIGFTLGFMMGNLAYEAVSALKEWDYSNGIKQHPGVDGDY